MAHKDRTRVKMSKKVSTWCMDDPLFIFSKWVDVIFDYICATKKHPRDLDIVCPHNIYITKVFTTLFHIECLSQEGGPESNCGAGDDPPSSPKRMSFSNGMTSYMSIFKEKSHQTQISNFGHHIIVMWWTKFETFYILCPRIFFGESHYGWCHSVRKWHPLRRCRWVIPFPLTISLLF